MAFNFALVAGARHFSANCGCVGSDTIGCAAAAARTRSRVPVGTAISSVSGGCCQLEVFWARSEFTCTAVFSVREPLSMSRGVRQTASSRRSFATLPTAMLLQTLSVFLASGALDRLRVI